MLPFGAALLLTAASAPLWVTWLRGPAWIDRPRPDRHHTRAVPRTGGAAWMAGTLAGILLGLPALAAAALAGALLAAFALGRLDETGRVGPLSKWLLQSLLLLAAWIALTVVTGSRPPSAMGLALVLPAAGAALFVQTALGIFDNLDGALGIAAGAGLAGLAVHGGAPWAETAALAGCGATVGFLVWNRPPARLFLGNTGSQALALLTSLLVLIALAPAAGQPRAHSAARSWALLLPLAWPCADLLFVSVTRAVRGTAPWRGGRDHTTHRLARALGSDRAAAVAILVVSGAGLLAALRLLGSAN